MLFSGREHTDYHKPSDTFEKINYTDQARILDLVPTSSERSTAPKSGSPTTAKTDPTPRTGGFRVYLNDSELRGK